MIVLIQSLTLDSLELSDQSICCNESLHVYKIEIVHLVDLYIVTFISIAKSFLFIFYLQVLSNVMVLPVPVVTKKKS